MPHPSEYEDGDNSGCRRPTPKHPFLGSWRSPPNCRVPPILRGQWMITVGYFFLSAPESDSGLRYRSQATWRWQRRPCLAWRSAKTAREARILEVSSPSILTQGLEPDRSRAGGRQLVVGVAKQCEGLRDCRESHGRLLSLRDVRQPSRLGHPTISFLVTLCLSSSLSPLCPRWLKTLRLLLRRPGR